MPLLAQGPALSIPLPCVAIRSEAAIPLTNPQIGLRPRDFLSKVSRRKLRVWTEHTKRVQEAQSYKWKTRIEQNQSIYFCRTILCISAAYAVMRCLSVCLSVCPSVRLSVTFVDHVKTNKHIFEIYSPSGSHTILVFPYQRGCQYSNGNPPNKGVECKGVWKNHVSRSVFMWSMLCTAR